MQKLFPLFVLLGLLSTACEPGGPFEPYPFNAPPARRHLNLERLLGSQELTLVSSADTQRLLVRFEPATRQNLVTNAATGDTVLRAWLTRYRGLYYFTSARDDFSFWVHAVRVGSGQVQGLTDDWLQMMYLRSAIDAGQWPELVASRTEAAGVRLRYDAQVLRPFYGAVLDSCPVYRIQPALRREAAPRATPMVLLRSVYPNPAHDWVNAEIGGSATYAVELLNERGQRVLVRQDSAASVRLPLEQVPAGTYVLRVRDAATGRAAWRRLVRQ